MSQEDVALIRTRYDAFSVDADRGRAKIRRFDVRDDEAIWAATRVSGTWGP